MMPSTVQSNVMPSALLILFTLVHSKTAVNVRLKLSGSSKIQNTPVIDSSPKDVPGVMLYRELTTDAIYPGGDDSMLSIISQENTKCEPINMPMCRGIKYNMTTMPNMLNHHTQIEAALEAHQFWPLIHTNCSSDLQFFLCSVYTPICLPNYVKPLLACKSMCKRVKAECTHKLLKYNFSMPKWMDCNQFPMPGGPNNLCMDHNESTKIGQSSGLRSESFINPSNSSDRCTGETSDCHQKSAEIKDCLCRCKTPLVLLLTNDTHSKSNKIIPGVRNCALPCHGYFLSKEERKFAAGWINFWSAMCAVSTLITVMTFLIDMQRFKYPERPIMYLSACYFVMSLGYLARGVMGHEEIACDGPALRSGAQGPGICLSVFLIIYFFGMASSVWWVILAFTWFLATGLKWGTEAIASYSRYYHFVAWVAPTAQTVWALLVGGITGDPVAGVCTVAPEDVQRFIIIPLLVYLLLGTSILLAGFVSLFRIRSAIKQSAANVEKIEKLMIRIGVFSILYTIPACTVLGCYIYESTQRDEWIAHLACPCRPPSKPLRSIIIIKYFMILDVGITSSVWIWGMKTFHSWQRVYQKLFSRDIITGKTGSVTVTDKRNKNNGKFVDRIIRNSASTASVFQNFALSSGSESTSHRHYHHHYYK